MCSFLFIFKNLLYEQGKVEGSISEPEFWGKTNQLTRFLGRGLTELSRIWTSYKWKPDYLTIGGREKAKDKGISL